MQKINAAKIYLTPEEIDICVDFAEKCAGTHEAKEFSEKSTKKRPHNEIVRDIVIGKMPEIAFQKIMKVNYGIDVDVDLNVYPEGVGDDQDAVINGWKLDIKGVRRGGKWFLMNFTKLDIRTRRKELSHFYPTFTVGWNRNTDKPENYVSFEGVAWINALRLGAKNTTIIRRGEFLPGTNTRLQTDNFGIRYEQLLSKFNGDKDLCFQRFIDFLLTNEADESILLNYHSPLEGLAFAG